MEPHIAHILEQMQVPGLLSPCRTPARAPAAPLRVCRVREVVRPLVTTAKEPTVAPAYADPLGLEDPPDLKDSRPRAHQLHRLVVTYGGQRRQFRSLWGLHSLLLHLASPDSPATSTWTILTRPQGNLRLGQWVHQHLPLNHWQPTTTAGAWQLEVGQGRPLYLGGVSVTPSLHALPEPSGLPHDGPRRRWPICQPAPSAVPAQSSMPAALPPDSPRGAHGAAPFVRRVASKPGKTRRHGSNPQPPMAARSSPHRPQLSAFTSPGLRDQPLFQSQPSKGGTPRQPVPPAEPTGQSRPDTWALQEQEALGHSWESGGHGTSIPLAASPDPACRRSHHARTHRHRPGVRRTKDMTTKLVCGQDKHVANKTDVTTSPLERQEGRHSRAQTQIHYTVQPAEHGMSPQYNQQGNEPMRHPAPVAIAPGAAGVVTMPRRGPIIINHPAVCNAICKNACNVSHDPNLAFQPLPPAAVRMLPNYRQNRRRKGIHIRPWACPARHVVSLAASKGGVASCQP